jgi:hypothetical protein
MIYYDRQLELRKTLPRRELSYQSNHLDIARTSWQHREPFEVRNRQQHEEKEPIS